MSNNLQTKTGGLLFAAGLHRWIAEFECIHCFHVSPEVLPFMVSSVRHVSVHQGSRLYDVRARPTCNQRQDPNYRCQWRWFRRVGAIRSKLFNLLGNALVQHCSFLHVSTDRRKRDIEPHTKTGSSEMPLHWVILSRFEKEEEEDRRFTRITFLVKKFMRRTFLAKTFTTVVDFFTRKLNRLGLALCTYIKLHP